VTAGRAAGCVFVAGIGDAPVQRNLLERGADAVAASLRELLDRRLVAAS